MPNRSSQHPVDAALCAVSAVYLRFSPSDAQHHCRGKMSVCLSLSVCHTPVLCRNSKRLNISSDFFHHRVASHIILVFLYQMSWQCSDFPPPMGRRMYGYEKLRFSTNISLCLGNNYYGTPVGTRMRSIECCFKWPWVTSKWPRFQGHDITQRQIIRKSYMIQWRANGKSYMIYRMAPFSMTLNDP